ncbi:MAG: hypothetical protein ACKVQC_11305 [Elusimicrobiota bacterium]
MLKKNISFFIFFFISSTFLYSQSVPYVPDIKELSYYLRQLESEKDETKILELNRLIHDGIVNAKLGDKKVLKELLPVIERVQIAMDSGLDRVNLTGEEKWLHSAMLYYEQEKNRQVIEVNETDIMTDQTQSLQDEKISVFPEKIIYIKNDQASPLIESTHINEAVVSPNGQDIGYCRNTDGHGEIWTIQVKNKKNRKVASSKGCRTLLFSSDSQQLFFQEDLSPNQRQSTVYRVPVSGGTKKSLGEFRFLQGIVIKGKYKGCVIALKNRKHHLGIANLDCTYAISGSNGKEVGRLLNIPCR